MIIDESVKKRLDVLEARKQRGRQDRFKGLDAQECSIEYLLAYAEEDAKHKLLECFVANNQLEAVRIGNE